MGKSNITKKNKTNVKESKWTGSVFILGDKQNLPTKHTFIIKTSGNKKTLTVLNQHNEVWNKKEGWGKELAEQYPLFIEDKPFKGFKAFTPKSILNNVMNLEKISIFITMRGSHQGGPRYSYKEQLVCSMMSFKDVASLKRFLSKHSKSNKKTKKGGLGSSDELKKIHDKHKPRPVSTEYRQTRNKGTKLKRHSTDNINHTLRNKTATPTPWSQRTTPHLILLPKFKNVRPYPKDPWKNTPRPREKKTVLQIYEPYPNDPIGVKREFIINEHPQVEQVPQGKKVKLNKTDVFKPYKS
tara:strand:- start:1379 stop:2269 length:891 start_codon:yes stop_codon:yes gene_type:complete